MRLERDVATFSVYRARSGAGGLGERASARQHVYAQSIVVFEGMLSRVFVGGRLQLHERWRWLVEVQAAVCYAPWFSRRFPAVVCGLVMPAVDRRAQGTR